jgi:hypothetical protein
MTYRLPTPLNLQEGNRRAGLTLPRTGVRRKSTNLCYHNISILSKVYNFTSYNIFEIHE